MPRPPIREPPPDRALSRLRRHRHGQRQTALRAALRGSRAALALAHLRHRRPTDGNGFEEKPSQGLWPISERQKREGKAPFSGGNDNAQS